MNMDNRLNTIAARNKKHLVMDIVVLFTLIVGLGLAVFAVTTNIPTMTSTIANASTSSVHAQPTTTTLAPKYYL
jgi:hypothetical protein